MNSHSIPCRALSRAGRLERPTLRLAVTLVLAALAWASPPPGLAKSAPSSLEGQVLNVGSGKPNGTLHLRGKMRAAGALDLGTAKLQVISFLSERKGSLELVSAEESRLNLLFASGQKIV